MNEKQIVEVNDSNFEAEVTDSSLPVLVDFYAPWCGPCKMLAPVLSKLAGEFQGKIKFAKVNVDEAPESAAAYNISSVPTLMLFTEGRKIRQLVGLVPAKVLTGILHEAIPAEETAGADNAR